MDSNPEFKLTTDFVMDSDATLVWQKLAKELVEEMNRSIEYGIIYGGPYVLIPMELDFKNGL